MKKIILLFLLTFTSLNVLVSQSESDDNLVSTFSKYFGEKKEVQKTNDKTIAFPKNSNKKTSEVVLETPKETSVLSNFYTSTIDGIIAIGKTFIGIPYRWGGTNEYGFDCSGFVKYIFNWFGYNLPRTSREMAKCGQYVPKSDLQRGDLIFFTGRNSRSGRVGHIGIVVDVEDNKINMMHSSSSKGVHIEDLNKNSYFKRRYITARRIKIDEKTYKVH